MYTMTVKRIIEELNLIERELLTKGFHEANCEMRLNYTDANSVWIEAHIYAQEGYSNRQQFDMFSIDYEERTPVKLLAALRKWADDLDTPEDVRKRAYLKKLSDLIVEGEDLGLDTEVDGVDVLHALVEQITSNLLTHRK